MKKTLLLMLVMASSFASAQLIVDENGRIGMNIETSSTLKSNVGIGTLGNTETSVFISQKSATHTTGLSVYRIEQHSGTSDFLMSVSGRGDIQGGNHNVGVFGGIWSNTVLGSGRTFGVMGIAGGASSGWNYGVCGMLGGAGNGAGVYGSTTWDNGLRMRT